MLLQDAQRNAEYIFVCQIKTTGDRHFDKKLFETVTRHCHGKYTYLSETVLQRTLMQKQMQYLHSPKQRLGAFW